MQSNNINTIFIADGVFNCDRFTFSAPEGGFIWSVTSPNRKTVNFSSGLWVGSKVGPQRELRLSAAFIISHYSPGNIPVVGQVPPLSVCNDTTWKVYLANLNDQSLTNGGIRTKTAGGRTYSFIYTSWATWPVAKGAPYAEINGIPGYQPGWNSDRPGIGNDSKARPDEICFMVYMDYTNCTNNPHVSQLLLPGGTLPLGMEVHQLSFMFSCPAMYNMYFMKWRLINKSQYNWDSTYITLFNDADIGERHDRAGCDTTRNLGFMYNNDDSDEVYGSNPPSIGFPLLQSPLRYTANINDTARLPYDTLIGYKLIGMTSFYATLNAGNQCNGDPDTATTAYNFMRGFDGCGNPIINRVTNQITKFQFSGNACSQSGWFDSAFGIDRRILQHSGPFTMNVRDTQVIVTAQIVTRDGGNYTQNVCALQSLSDSALKYYYNDFRTCIPIGIQPISSEVPDRFALYQNYPNPFNPVTKLRFDIPVGTRRGTFVQMIIYDILGREIATLVNEELKPGTYEVEWNAENFPSGVYFYQLTSSGFTQTNKMVLLK